MWLQNGELIWKDKLSVKYESMKWESWRTIIQLYIYNESSFTNGNDSLMEIITFINEDTIRYKYYCHENEKWKANRKLWVRKIDAKLCVMHVMKIFTTRRRELFYYFLVTSDLKWKWKITNMSSNGK